MKNSKNTLNTDDYKPKISVIIPVYNGEKYLSAAIDSVLGQTYENIEIIVIDDGSTDQTRKIALSYSSVKYYFQENKGVSAAKNYGIQKATSDFISFLDADDLWISNKLAIQINVLVDDPSIDIVTGYVEQFISPDADLNTKEKYGSLPGPIKGYVSAAILVKKSIFEKAGLFPEDDRVGETIFWFSNVLAKEFKIHVLPNIVYRRRIHGNNMSILSKKEKDSQMLKILKESIDRKRSKKSN